MKNRLLLQILLATVAIWSLAACGLGAPSSAGAPNSFAGPLTALDPAEAAGFSVNWPETAASIMAEDDAEPMLNQDRQQPAPIASAAKIITVLSILAEHPLGETEDGPVIVLDHKDVKRFEAYRQVDGSVLPVYQGMQLTQRQAFATMLLPSANNIADSLAVWAFGSLEDYRSAAQKFVAGLDLDSTTVGIDASGFDPSTTSTAHDLALLAKAAMKSPVVADLVARSEFSIPGYGRVQNTNSLLGVDGVLGLKTGTSKQAHGVFLFAAKATVQGKPTTVVGAVQGAGDRAQDAIAQAQQMLKSMNDRKAAEKPSSAAATVLDLPAKLPAKVALKFSQLADQFAPTQAAQK